VLGRIGAQRNVQWPHAANRANIIAYLRVTSVLEPGGKGQ
jgi:hypothetical protein